MLDLVPFISGRIGMPSLLGWEPFLAGSPVAVDYQDDHVFVTADMPGVDPNDLELTYETGTLYVAGKRGDQVYRFTVDVGDQIDPDKIDAQLDKGVLTIRAEKKAEAKPRKIALKGVETKTLESGEGKAA